MIRNEGKLFLLETENTSYAFYHMESGHLEHLYYGNKLMGIGNPDDFIESSRQKSRFLPGNLISYSGDYENLGLELLRQEISSLGKGDVREPFVILESENGFRTSDFLYVSSRIKKKSEVEVLMEGYRTLPYAYDEKGETETLELILEDPYLKARLTLHYSVFYDSDVIVRSAKIENFGSESWWVKKLMSLQLDLGEKDWDITSFSGAWAREMGRRKSPHPGGMWVNTTGSGVSSNRANPFFILGEPGTSETKGECIGFNLSYSGNHYSSVESGTSSGLRILVGVRSEDLEMRIPPGEKLFVPEAMMSYSAKGFRGLSHNYHGFIRENVVRGSWKKKERPVLLNSWEAYYFKFHEAGLMKLAEEAKAVGMELFVLDDGWFGNRKDDRRGLGDWEANEKKLPGGLKGVSEKIHGMGMKFGVWVEPEMVNEDSALFREHPDWVLRNPETSHSLGRNQMILDLTKEKVQDFIVKKMSEVFHEGKVDYVKWDMNRIFSDWYSVNQECQKALPYRYVLGLYSVLDRLNRSFPDVLFEGCASGGNRFDLGMLSYMPQIWASDNTDAISRLDIQEGYSYGYPLSVFGAHVSDCPNHQTLRVVPLNTRQGVASFGLLGYEMNLRDMDRETKREMREHVEVYKEWRGVFQFGEFFREEKKGNLDTHETTIWSVVSQDQKKAVVGIFQKLFRPNQMEQRLRIEGLLEEGNYKVYNIPFQHDLMIFGDLINHISPVHIGNHSMLHRLISKVHKLEGETEIYRGSGSVLRNCGVLLKQGFGGVGFDEEVRLVQDFGSRLYFVVLEE